MDIGTSSCVMPAPDTTQRPDEYSADREPANRLEPVNSRSRGSMPSATEVDITLAAASTCVPADESLWWSMYRRARRKLDVEVMDDTTTAMAAPARIIFERRVGFATHTTSLKPTPRTVTIDSPRPRFSSLPRNL